MEWGWGAYAETYYASAKVSQKGAQFSVDGEADIGEAVVAKPTSVKPVERSRATPPPQVYFPTDFCRFEAHFSRTLFGGGF